jgi:hypothetical protein
MLLDLFFAKNRKNTEGPLAMFFNKKTPYDLCYATQFLILHF